MKKKVNYNKIYDEINNAKLNNDQTLTYDFGRQADHNKVVEIFKDLQLKGYTVVFKHENRGIQLKITF